MKNEKNIKFLNFLISYDLKLQKLHIKSYYFISKLTNLIYTHLFLRGAENETIDVCKGSNIASLSRASKFLEKHF